MMLIAMLAAGKTLERIVTVPAQFAHALFGRIVRPNGPLLQILKVLAACFLLREVREQCLLLTRRQCGEIAPKPFLRFSLDSGKRGNKFPLVFGSVHTQQQIDEPIYSRLC
jgi:hypothetical protein